jgi:outer membrane protein
MIPASDKLRPRKFWQVWGLVIVTALVVWAAGAAAGHAEEPAEQASSASITAPGGITLEQAVRAALTHNQPFLISQENVTQLVQQRREAFSALLPSLTFDANASRRPKSVLVPNSTNILRAEEEYNYSLTLTQPLFAGGKGVNGLQFTSTQLHAGEQAMSQSREDLLLSVAQAYYGVLKASKQVELFEAERKRLEEHRRAADARVRVGDATKTVLLRAEAELAGAAASLIRARSDEAIARDQLAKLTGLSADSQLETPLPPAAPSALSDALIHDAHAQRPELLRSQLSEQAALQNVRVARSGLFPSLWLDLVYDVGHQNPDAGFGTEEADKYAMLRLTFPFFEGGLQIAKIQQARSQWRSAMFDTQYVKETVDTEVRTALREVEALTGSIEQFTAQVRFAKENYELTSRQFAVGLATNIDLLDANSTLLSAEQQLATGTFDRDLAVLQLYKSVGRLTGYLLNE